VQTMTTEERLAKMRGQMEELEAKARSGSRDAKSHIQRQLATVREQEVSVRAAAKKPADAFDERFEQFEARLRVAQRSIAADLAENRQAFADAVEGELQTWDAYFERLQAQTALRAASAREQAEAAIRDLRGHRNAVAEHLASARAASDEAWAEQKKRLAAERDELERKADELSAKFN
jgi:hypothetical protein